MLIRMAVCTLVVAIAAALGIMLFARPRPHARIAEMVLEEVSVPEARTASADASPRRELRRHALRPLPVLEDQSSPVPAPVREGPDEPAISDLAPELQGLWPTEVEARRDSAFRDIIIAQARAAGLSEPFQVRLADTMKARRKATLEVINKKELFEITPEEADERFQRIESETQAARRQLFTEAGVADPDRGFGDQNSVAAVAGPGAKGR